MNHPLNIPIAHHYPSFRPEELSHLQRQSEVRVVKPSAQIAIENRYFQGKLKGSSPHIFARESVVNALTHVCSLLPEGYGLSIFDLFRSRTTQLALFDQILKEVKERNPNLSENEAWTKTRTYVAHPDEVSRFTISPHNSGGAIDLTLTYQGKVVDMGGEFDEPTERSTTLFFENPKNKNEFDESKWENCRLHRRILFNAMIKSGFVNYVEEWWHYDLGDCIWAQEKKSPWWYPSMEEEVEQLARRL